MPLGPDRCNGPSGYRDSTVPLSSLMRSEGSIRLLINKYMQVVPHVSFIMYTEVLDRIVIYIYKQIIIIGNVRIVRFLSESWLERF